MGEGRHDEEDGETAVCITLPDHNVNPDAYTPLAPPTPESFAVPAVKRGR